jgi:hypothetical protein
MVIAGRDPVGQSWSIAVLSQSRNGARRRYHPDAAAPAGGVAAPDDDPGIDHATHLLPSD